MARAHRRPMARRFETLVRHALQEANGNSEKFQQLIAPVHAEFGDAFIVKATEENGLIDSMFRFSDGTIARYDPEGYMQFRSQAYNFAADVNETLLGNDATIRVRPTTFGAAKIWALTGFEEVRYDDNRIIFVDESSVECHAHRLGNIFEPGSKRSEKTEDDKSN